LKRDQQHDDYSKGARAEGEDFRRVFREATPRIWAARTHFELAALDTRFLGSYP